MAEKKSTEKQSTPPPCPQHPEEHKAVWKRGQGGLGGRWACPEEVPKYIESPADKGIKALKEYIKKNPKK